MMEGKLDKVAIWNRQLTTAELQELYNSGSGLTIARCNYCALEDGLTRPCAACKVQHAVCSKCLMALSHGRFQSLLKELILYRCPTEQERVTVVIEQA